MNWAEEEGIRPDLRQAIEEFRRNYEGKMISCNRGGMLVPRFHYYGTDVMEKAMLLFRDKGNPGERFAETIDRLGFENVEKELIG